MPGWSPMSLSPVIEKCHNRCNGIGVLREVRCAFNIVGNDAI